MQIIVSPPQFEDWPALLALLREAFAYMDTRIDPPSSLQQMGVDELRSKAQEEILILASDHAGLAACVFAAIKPDCVYVGKLAVAACCRGRGIGRELMTAAETIACESGRGFLELQARIELVENHRAFAALGFEKLKETAHPGYDRPTSITMRKRVSQLPRRSI